jgi:hypothetical protein
MKKTFFTVASILLSAAMVVGLSSCKGKDVNESDNTLMQPEQVEDYNDYVSDFEEAYSIEEMDEDYEFEDEYIEKAEKNLKEVVEQAEAELDEAIKTTEAEVQKALEEAEAELEAVEF